MAPVLRKLVGYAAYMFGANVFTALLTFAVTAFGMAARSKEAFGDYFTYMLVYEIGTGLLINGVNATIQKYSAENKENRLRFTKLVFIAFVLMNLVCVALGLAVYWTGWLNWTLEAVGLPFHIVGGLNFTLGFLGIPWVVTNWYGRYVVRSTLDARREARLMVIASLSSSVFRFIFLTFTDLRDAMIYGDFVALVVSGAAALIMLPRAVEAPLGQIMKTELPKPFLKEALQFSIPLWLAGLVFTAKSRLQAVWTRGRIGQRAMGALGGLQLFGMLYEKPMEFLGQASLPGLVAANDKRDQLYRELLRFSIVVLGGIAVGVSAGVPLAFDVIDFIQQLFGQSGESLFTTKYAEVPLLMMIAALAMPFRAVEMVTNQYSVAVGRQRSVFYAQVTQLAVMSVTLIPLAEAYGLYGVVVAGLIGEVANAFTFVVLLYKVRRDSMRSAAIWSVLSGIGATCALAPAWYFRDLTYNWALAFPAIAVYVGVMFAIRLLSPADFGRVTAAIKARRGG